MTLKDAYRKQREEQPKNGQACPAEPPPWEAIVPLCVAPEPPPFPEDVLPDALMQFAIECASSVPCAVDYVAVPMLVIAGASIAAARAVEIKYGRIERPCLYAALIGPPSCGKTPMLGAAARPIHQEQARLYDEYKRAIGAFEDGAADRKPTERVLYVSDVTTEKLATILQENPRGVAVIRDELTGWVRSMDQYRAGRGADRQFWLSAWSGDPISVHRKTGAETVRVSHPYVSVVGGLPPDLLTTMRGERAVADGFLERILWSYPHSMPAAGEMWRCVPEYLEQGWADCLATLRGLEQEQSIDHGPRPQLVGLTSSGRAGWQKLTEGLADARNDASTADCLQGALGKLNSYGGRMALIVHLLRWATGEDVGESVDGESMRRAEQLVTYFLGQAQRVYACLDADPRVAAGRKLLEWVRGVHLGRFTRRDAYRALRGTVKAVEDVDPLLSLLERHGYIRRLPGDPAGGPGRKASPLYEHSLLDRGQNGHNGQNADDDEPAF